MEIIVKVIIGLVLLAGIFTYLNSLRSNPPEPPEQVLPAFSNGELVQFVYTRLSVNTMGHKFAIAAACMVVHYVRPEIEQYVLRGSASNKDLEVFVEHATNALSSAYGEFFVKLIRERANVFAKGEISADPKDLPKFDMIYKNVVMTLPSNKRR